MKELSVNGITLRYEVRGHGDPLILLHGNGEDHRIFNTRLLEPHFSCYLIDSRGHGLSTRLPELHYREMATDILEFIRRLDLHQVTFAGFSDGGIIGLIAASQTDRIRTLIACGANTSPDGLILPFRIINHVVLFLTRSPLFRLMIEEPDIKDEELQKITARTLIIAGQHDVVRKEETDHIASCIKGAREIIVRCATHTSYVVHSDRLAEMILRFTGIQRSSEN
ncbi:MAG: alpha/beta fold hydrolase [Chordicoccus sp.]